MAGLLWDSDPHVPLSPESFQGRRPSSDAFPPNNGPKQLVWAGEALAALTKVPLDRDGNETKKGGQRDCKHGPGGGSIPRRDFGCDKLACDAIDLQPLPRGSLM